MTRKWCLLLMSICLLSSASIASKPRKSTSAQRIFKSHLHGWYPTEPAALQRKLDQLYMNAKQNYNAYIPATAIRTIIAPHAGLEYSGTVAASVYRLVQGSHIKRVIILAPSHFDPFNAIAVPSFTHYQLPIGTLKVDNMAVTRLTQSPLFIVRDATFATEHAVEMQLPFVQSSLPNSLIVPLIVGTLTPQQIQTAAHTLAPLIDASTLVVISSDFIHYGKRFAYEPFHDAIAYRIRQLDSQAIQLIQDHTLKKFLSFFDQTHATICGQYPLAILIALLQAQTLGRCESRLISYATSNDNGTNPTGSVSYVGLAFVHQENTPLQHRFTQYEQHALLTMARSMLKQSFDKKIPYNLLTPILSNNLLLHHSVFVTLRKQGQLRGCIGRITTDKPLYQTVADMTRAAAFDDTRFTPLTHQEVPDVTITISVLSSPRTIKNYHEIQLGKHGIILHHGATQAVFLPEVAIDEHWDLATTLEQLSIKAGLPPRAWKDQKTTFEVFETVEWGQDFTKTLQSPTLNKTPL